MYESRIDQIGGEWSQNWHYGWLEKGVCVSVRSGNLWVSRGVGLGRQEVKMFGLHGYIPLRRYQWFHSFCIQFHFVRP